MTVKSMRPLLNSAAALMRLRCPGQNKTGQVRSGQDKRQLEMYWKVHVLYIHFYYYYYYYYYYCTFIHHYCNNIRQHVAHTHIYM